MTNALQAPIPFRQPGAGPASAAIAAAPPAPGPAPGGSVAPGQPQQPPAPPTHEQTVAALRHFDAVKQQLGAILKDPAVGKSDMKSKIIDGVTRLVAEGFMPATAAVDELSKVPSDPLQQLHWAQAMMAQTKNAENNILDHYGMGNPHFGTVAEHMAMPIKNNRADHLDHIAAMTSNYKAK